MSSGNNFFSVFFGSTHMKREREEHGKKVKISNLLVEDMSNTANMRIFHMFKYIW